MLRGSRGRLAVCLGGLVGAVHAVSLVGEPVDPSAQYPWGALSAGVDGTLRVVGPVTLGGGVDLVLPLVRHQFRVTGRQGVDFQQESLTVVGWAAVGVQIP